MPQFCHATTNGSTTLRGVTVLRKTPKWLIAMTALVAAIAASITWFLTRPSTPDATPKPTVAGSSSPKVTSDSTRTATPSTSPNTPSSRPTTEPTRSSPNTTTIDTSTWPRQIDCQETPEATHLAFCRVSGKSQVQIVNACKSAAAGSLWYSSPEHSYGSRDPRLWVDIRTCARGAGIHLDENTYVMGWPADGKPRAAIQYIMVRGSGSSTDMFEHVFYATGPDSRLGFAVHHNNEMVEKIGDLYMSFGRGE